MFKKTFIFISIAATLLTGAGCANTPAKQIKMNPMRITSPAFQNNGYLPLKFSCDGEGVNPPLNFAEIPDNTKTLALIVSDPDAVSGNFTHWTIWNIPPQTAAITENSVPAGAVQGVTSAHSKKFVPPCPPSGSHRYIFTLYALDTKLTIPDSASRNDLLQAMTNHILKKADAIAIYER